MSRERQLRHAKQAAALADPALVEVQPLLQDAQREGERGMRRWLKTALVAGAVYTALHHVRLLGAMAPALVLLRRVPPTMISSLGVVSVAASALVHKHFRSMVLPSIPTPRAQTRPMGTASILRIHAYPDQVEMGIRRQLAAGILRQETVEHMLMRLSKRAQPSATKPTPALATAGLFKGAGSESRRLIVTETQVAYNAHMAQAMHETQAALPGLKVRWNAIMDARTCRVCGSLHNRIASVGGEFPGGYREPPIHFYCRCILEPWTREASGELGQAA